MALVLCLGCKSKFNRRGWRALEKLTTATDKCSIRRCTCGHVLVIYEREVWPKRRKRCWWPTP